MAGIGAIMPSRKCGEAAAIACGRDIDGRDIGVLDLAFGAAVPYPRLVSLDAERTLAPLAQPDNARH